VTTITPEIRQAIEQAGEQPVQLTDPETSSVYVIVRAEVYVGRVVGDGLLPLSLSTPPRTTIDPRGVQEGEKDIMGRGDQPSRAPGGRGRIERWDEGR